MNKKKILFFSMLMMVLSILSAASEVATLSEGTAFDYSDELSFFLETAEKDWFNVKVEMSEYDWSLQPLTAGSSDTSDPTSTGDPGDGDDLWTLNLPHNLDLFALNLSARID